MRHDESTCMQVCMHIMNKRSLLVSQEHPSTDVISLEQLRTIKVMVIDDSNTIRRTAEIFLKAVGCEIVLAEGIL